MHCRTRWIASPFVRALAGCAALLVASLPLGACATYVPPAGRADLSSISSVSMQESFAAKPAAHFPAAIATARVQASGYSSWSTDRVGGVYGRGRYSVISVREVEEDQQLAAVAGLPQVHGVVPISTLLLPTNLESDKDLREAAARLKADMLFLYTFDTTLRDNDHSVTLSVLTLGVAPTHKVSVCCTASGLLIDTRTGFIYAAFDGSASRDLGTNAWESAEAADRARVEVEREAFTKLVEGFVRTWPAVVERAGQGA